MTAPAAPQAREAEAEWETVIGLEVHAELRTRTKLFCACPNSFGDEPNTNVCPVCLGLPGSLPVINRAAVEFAIRIGTALNCRVQPSLFHRKNYFYPDMPKDYQISQYDIPINTDGWLDLPDGRRIGIVRAHMEEDTGKTTHVGGGGRIHDAAHSLVDYNRAGVPLVEIVGAPDIRSADEARAYVDELRAILVATGASDGKMEEGSLRVDANVSVRRAGTEEFGTRCEIKNMNSLRSLGRAIQYEAERQIALLSEGGTVVQETRHWDEGAGRTGSMRSKEEAYDYRYFPEPDLVPVNPADEWVSEISASLPPLPAARREAVADASGMAAGDDSVVTVVRLDLDRYVEAVARSATSRSDGHGSGPALAVRRLANEVASQMDSLDNLSEQSFTSLVEMEASGALTPAQSRTVLKELLDSGGDPQEVATRFGFESLGADALTEIVDRVIAEHPDEWARFAAGEDKLMGFFAGHIRALSDGNADMKAAATLLRSRRG